MRARIQTTIKALLNRQGAMILLWIVFVVASLVTMTSLTSRLRQREENYMRLWAYSVERLNDDEYDENNVLIDMVVQEGNNIPFIMINEKGLYNENVTYVEGAHLIRENVIENRERLERKLSKLARVNDYIILNFPNGERRLVFYDRSRTLVLLTWLPIVQAVALALLLWLWVAAFRSNKVNEQNRVWAGLAKETAHQLGTPTSSLLGWVDYLKTQPVDQEAVAEMDKDLVHLRKVADRFSKIGSETPLEPTSLNELVGEAVMYFRKRIPRNVELNYNGLAMAPIHARINPALFEWVVENLLKNALDALQGHGTIDVKLWRDEKYIYIDVTDSGKGIPRANWKKIFEPGFSTKTRGWGLGLSLSRRVIEEYHKGKIFVAESEVGKGTVMRICIR